MTLAIRSGNTELILYLISKLSGSSWITDELIMELYVLPVNSQLRILPDLVHRGFDLNRIVNIAPSAKSTLLILSIIDGKLDLASWLLANSSCDVNCGVGDIEFPLTAAGRNAKALELLLSRQDLDKSVTNVSGETILHIMATQNDPIALRKYLTHFGELIEAKDVLGATALIRAIASKCHENAQILLENKAQVGAITNEEMNSLHIAACLSAIAAFELLLSAGGEINAQNKFGNTPLMEAALVANQTDGQFLRFLKFAIDNEADLGKTNNYGKSLLHLLAIKELPKALEIVKQSKINLNQKDENGHTALVDSLLSGSVYSTKILLSPSQNSDSQVARFDRMKKTVGTVFHAAKHADKRIEELQVAELLRYAVKNSLDISDILSITDSHGKTLKQTLSVDSYRLILLAMKE